MAAHNSVEVGHGAGWKRPHGFRLPEVGKLLHKGEQMKLFDIGTELYALLDLLEESGGEITDENREAFDAFQKEIELNQGEKIDRVVNLIHETDGLRALAQAEADRYQKGASVKANAVKSLKGFLFNYLQFTQQTKLVTPTARTVSIVGNGGLKPIEYVPDIDPKELSDEFVTTRTVVELNRDAVRQALEAGRELPFAKLCERGKRLAIK